MFSVFSTGQTTLESNAVDNELLIEGTKFVVHELYFLPFRYAISKMAKLLCQLKSTL